MRPSGPTSWLLDGRTGWRTSDYRPVGAPRPTVSAGGAGLQLAAVAGGPLSLTSADGSLGRLVLPKGMDFDESYRLHLLDEASLRVRRYDRQPGEAGRFVDLPGIGGRGAGARHFAQPRNIAIAGGMLFVADRGARRVQAFGLRSLALRHLWSAAEAPLPPSGDLDPWLPVDVVAHAGQVLILDGRHGRVLRHLRGSDRLVQVVGPPAPLAGRETEPWIGSNRWSRLAVDRAGRLYLLDATGGQAHLDVFTADGRRLTEIAPGGRRPVEIADAAAIRDRFAPPGIVDDGRGRFCLPPSLSRACDRRPPDPPASLTEPLALCLPGNEDRPIFDRRGTAVRVEPGGQLGMTPYLTHGTWISERLDSDIARCQWHRIELDLAALPVGTLVEIGTFASDEPLSDQDIGARPAAWWNAGAPFYGGARPAASEAKTGATREDVLVQSRPGRYLWLKVELHGDGRATPVVSRLRVHYPRESYLRYLPAVFSEDEESRWFLERFLAIFQTEWDQLEQRIAETAIYLDPAAAPGGPFLDYLASWLAVPLERAWDDAQKRRLLKAAPRLTPRRGTIDGVRDVLRVYLENITGRELARFADLPMIVEGYRERDHLTLNEESRAELGATASLWGPAVVGRLQLGVHARAGEARLLSTGDPERDLFHRYAHRFSVFVPATWVRTARDERMVRRALDAEKPAHTLYDLCLIESRFQVGLQSTLGLDTIVGDYPVARLGCRDDPATTADDETADPPSRRLRHRLGYDTVLACPPCAEPLPRLAPGMRLGVAAAAG